jgi:anti-anti-sigma regulatory factor
MTSSNSKVQLDAHLELAVLPELVQRLQEPLAQGKPLVLDGSAVQSVDGASLQLLLAATRAARQEHIPCGWHQPSPPLKKAAALLGITDELLLEVTE